MLVVVVIVVVVIVVRFHLTSHPVTTVHVLPSTITVLTTSGIPELPRIRD